MRFNFIIFYLMFVLLKNEEQRETMLLRVIEINKKLKK